MSARKGRSRRITLADFVARPLNPLAFGFGSGLMPVAPGTFGTIAAIPLYLLLAGLPLVYYLAVVVLACIAGVWICASANRTLGSEDHSGIVWDEICGYLITMAGAPFAWSWAVTGFLLFRIFDIIKPWPIRAVERRVGGGLGVMLDDILAGLLALLCLQVLVRLW